MLTELFILESDYIALCDLLKATHICSSGGMAKHKIVQGEVWVDGKIERRKTCKIRPGQVVTGAEFTIQVQSR